MLAKSKLNSIATLVSQTLIDMEISHGEFITILKEKDKYGKMKENLKSENELIRLQCEIKDLKQKLNEKQSKLLSILCHQKIYFFLVYV